MNRTSDWSLLETNKHQDHVIAHVLGSTVQGWFVAGEAAHLLLDIGFLWTIYLDAEMNLLPQGVAISELEGDELSSADKAELAFDAQLLLNEGRDAEGLKKFRSAPVECLVKAVEIFGFDSDRRVVVQGESSNIRIDSSLESSQLTVHAQANHE